MKHKISWSFIGHFCGIILFNIAFVLYTKTASLYKALKKLCIKIHKFCCKDQKKAVKEDDVDALSKLKSEGVNAVKDYVMSQEDRERVKNQNSDAAKNKNDKISRKRGLQTGSNNNQINQQRITQEIAAIYDEDYLIQQIRRELDFGGINSLN